MASDTLAPGATTNNKGSAERLGLMVLSLRANIIKGRKMDMGNSFSQMVPFMKENFKWMKCRV